MEYSYEDFLELVSQSPDNPDENNIVTQTLNLIQGRWVQHILFQLCRRGTCRFGELKKALPQISKSMLSSVLKQLESNGLVTRQQFNEIPPHTEYTLTPQGRELMPIFYEIFRWGTKYIDADFIHKFD